MSSLIPKHYWRHFRPPVRSTDKVLQAHRPDTANVFAQAQQYVNGLFPGRHFPEQEIATAIQSVRDRAAANDDPIFWVAALILQAPRAASAQQQMDQHPHGYHNKHARLFELIDFNDTFVSAVLSLPESLLPHFVSETKQAMDAFCKRLNTRAFSNEQYDAITYGLSREIAVYRSSLKAGYEVEMTSRAQDAMGVDMVITDPSSHLSVNIDCKAHSAYYYRLKELRHEGRLRIEEFDEAELRGYCQVVNGHDNEQVRVILWRIDEETYGKIENFAFAQTAHFTDTLYDILHRYGQ